MKLKELENRMKSIAKSNKTITYSTALLLSFLMGGKLTTANEVDLSSTLKKTKNKLSEERKRNNKKLKLDKLELIQLEEQGNQVVKNPWSSWQFGVGYNYDAKIKEEKTEKDSSRKGLFSRDSDWSAANVGKDSYGYGLLSQETLLNSATGSNRNGLENYSGITQLNKIEEKALEFENAPSVNLNIATPTITDINYGTPTLNLSYTVPTIQISSFSAVQPAVTIPNMFTPPALAFVLTGFGQGSALGWNAEGSVIIGNADVYPVNSSNVKDTSLIVDLSYNGANFVVNNNSFGYKAINDRSLGLTSPVITQDTGGVKTTTTYALGTKHTFINALANSYTTEGNWKLTNTAPGGIFRFVSVNHAFGNKEGVNDYKLDGNLELSSVGNNYTIGIEYQSFDALPQTASIEVGRVMTLQSGKQLIGASLMIERDHYDANLYQENGTLNGVTGGGIANKAPMQKSAFLNHGKIVINSAESLGIDFGEYNHDGQAMTIYTKVGNIEVNGQDNYGIRVPDIFTGIRGKTNVSDYFRETIIDGQGGTILVQGNKNVGISLSRNIQGSVNVANEWGVTSGITNDIIGNIMNLDIKLNGSNGIGVLRNSNFLLSTGASLGTVVLGETHLRGVSFGTEADESVLIRTDRSDVELSKTSKINLNTTLSAGKGGNVIMLANDNVSNDSNISLKSKVVNKSEIEASTGLVELTGLMAYNGGIADNQGSFTLNGAKSVGMFIEKLESGSNRESEGINTGNVTMTADKSVGVYNQGKFNMTAGTIDVKGNQSVAVYSKGNTSVTNVNGGTLKASNGAIALYPDTGSTILYNADTEVGNGGLLVYNYDISFTPTGSVSLGAAATATIKSGGTAFYLYGSSATTTGIDLTSVINPGGSLTINMADKNATLFLLDSPTGTISLSNALANPSLPVNITVIGDPSYKRYSVIKGHLQVDNDVNLDDTTDIYKNVSFLSSKVTVDAGKTMLGNNANEVVISQKNAGTASNTDIAVTNNGTIQQTGTNSVGIVTDYGYIHNTSTGKVIENGVSSIALLGARGAEIINDGEISLGDGALGIVGINFLGTTPPAYGNNNITIKHNGIIKTTGTTGTSIGIIADNLNSGVATIDLGNGSKIDMSSSIGSTAIYTNNASIIDNGVEIDLGTNGTGLYIKGSNTILNAGYIRSANDNVIGVYSDGNVISNKEITLTGNGSAGIFVNGATSDVSNAGNITIGNSIEAARNVGIYNGIGAIDNFGIIKTGSKSIGIYSKGTGFNLKNNSELNINDEGIGVYKVGGTVNLDAGSKLNVGQNSSVSKSVGVYAKDGVTINNNTSDITIDKGAFGFVLSGTANVFTSNIGAGNISLGDNSIFVYSESAGSSITNDSTVKSTANNNFGIYASSGETVNNSVNGIIDFKDGKSNVGIYNANGTVDNFGKIYVGASEISDLQNIKYAVGVYADNSTVKNHNEIKITGNYGIGLFGTNGANIVNETNGKIYLDASSGTITQMTGVYIEGSGTIFTNKGLISTVSDYTSNANVSGLRGIVVRDGATLINQGIIKIDANSGFGALISGGANGKAIIKNYGTIEVTGIGSSAVTYRDAQSTSGQALATSNAETEIGGTLTSNGSNIGATNEIVNDPTQQAGSVEYKKDPITNETMIFVDGRKIEPREMYTIPGTEQLGFSMSNIGMYVDTLGGTKPVSIPQSHLNYVGDNDLIFGAEAARNTKLKTIEISGNILNNFNNELNSTSGKFKLTSGALTWTVSFEENAGRIEKVFLTKIPYTDYAKGSEIYNFTEGLEQRYSMNEVDSREKELFNKLNDIGSNEHILLEQAFYEMLGLQYSSVQKRIINSRDQISNGINNLFTWDTKSKQSNKLMAIGNHNKYESEIKDMPDYDSNSAGIAFLNQNETVKLGDSAGFYGGLLYNQFKFKDNEKSKEDAIMGQMGLYKSTAFDNNNSLNWIIKGDITGGYHKMHRKYLVVDEVFNAKGNYYSYGANVENEIVKNFRVSEGINFGILAGLNLGYGKYTDIKENKGEVRLEIKGNDYYSIKPSAGVKIGFDNRVGETLRLKTELSAIVEKELGEVTDVQNRARVKGTTADYYNLIKDKDQDVNGKIGLNFELGNDRFGVMINGEYNTSNEEINTGIGIKYTF